VGESAVTSVSSLLDTTIDGVKVMAKAPFKGGEKEKKDVRIGPASELASAVAAM
jgi:hypothetical protein